MTKFRKWDDLSELEQLQNIYSDDHKDTYGFRPRPSKEQWDSLEWLQGELGSLRKTKEK